MDKIFTKFVIVLFILLISQQLFAAGGRIAGIVTDATTDEPLSGANVFLEGTSIGTATDLEGGYIITNVPAGSYQLSVVYIGYKSVTQSIEVQEDQQLKHDIALNAVAISGEEIVVTAQAVGQNAAINKQLASENIVNVVSSARIQELPDANAAESIGRLPGVSLIREGGQATKVVIRGLSPEYSQITLNGVPIPPNESDQGGSEYGGGRGGDMRMISSNMLDEIKISKTNTPDMDAAVLGGTVDLGIRKADRFVLGESSIWSFLPAAASLQAQGGYTNLTDEYNNYKFDLMLEQRYLDGRFGVLLQGIIQQQNLTTNRLDVDYTQLSPDTDPDRLGLTHLNLYFYPRKEKRYNGTITLDYDLPAGNLALTNIFSQSKTNEDHYRQNYGIGQRGGNDNHYYGYRSLSELNLITNILNYNQKSNLLNIDATLSHSYSENIAPDTWELRFEQLTAGTYDIDIELRPEKIAELAYQTVHLDSLHNPDALELRNLFTENRFTRQRELRGAIDLDRTFNIADFLSLDLKAGGMYAYTDRSYDYNRGYGWIRFGELGQRLVETFPEFTDYGIDAVVNPIIPIAPFLDPDLNIGTYLDGDYAFNDKLDLDYLNKVRKVVMDYGMDIKTISGGNPPWTPDMFRSVARDYSGEEHRSAGYLMGTFNISQMVTVIAGARYQNLTTKYRANRFYNASQGNSFPNEFPARIDTTFEKSHGYWLPAFHLNFKPLSWISVRAAYTNTLAYPNFRTIIPIIHVYSGGPNVDWNDVSLKPIRSKNFDLQLSMYNNTIGLFTFGGFLKHIDDFVFSQRKQIIDATQYEGLTRAQNAYRMDTYYNNPYQVEVWGIESDWQTHFWYLPGALRGLVLNVNYTHTFSEARYPKTIVNEPTGFPPVITYTDTSYTESLINQPDDIINVSLGWDYKGFSVLLSMIYQSSIFHSTDFWEAYRTDKAEYTRFDLVAKQRLPWYNMEIFLNLNNLNGENDTYIQRGNSFPESDYSYGLTAQLGLKVNVR
jgi:TonB-dependent receptor